MVGKTRFRPMIEWTCICNILHCTTRTIACHIMRDIVDACVTKMYLCAHPIVLPGDTHQDNELDTRHAEGTPHKTMSWRLGMTRDVKGDTCWDPLEH